MAFAAFGEPARMTNELAIVAVVSIIAFAIGVYFIYRAKKHQMNTYCSVNAKEQRILSRNQRAIGLY